MTNYITSVGVQQVSITIASGATSNTATITAVGSGAFIIYQGHNPSDTANLNDTLTKVTLTNSTTVTATRGASGSAQTVVINAVVIDGDTTNLVKSVQTGSIAIATGSSTHTATITAVTNTNAVVNFLGLNNTSGSTSLTNTHAILSLSGTTVTATSANATPAAGSVNFQVIEFQGTALNSSTQNVAIVQSSANTVTTATITSVTTGNAWLAFGGYTGASGTNQALDFERGVLTNATTITATRGQTGSAGEYNCCVVEFIAGLLNQSAQRGTIALATQTSNTATITSSSTTNGFCNWLGYSTADSTFNPAATETMVTQTNATTITMTLNSSQSGTGSFEVIEFPAFSGGGASPMFQRGSMDGLSIFGPKQFNRLEAA